MVPTNRPNKDGKPSAEGEEGRSMIKENVSQPHTSSTQSETSVSQGLEGVRRAAKENKETRFTALLHHMTLNLMRDSFYALKRRAAPGSMASRGRTMRQAWRIGLDSPRGLV